MINEHLFHRRLDTIGHISTRKLIRVVNSLIPASQPTGLTHRGDPLLTEIKRIEETLTNSLTRPSCSIDPPKPEEAITEHQMIIDLSG